MFVHGLQKGEKNDSKTNLRIHHMA